MFGHDATERAPASGIDRLRLAECQGVRLTAAARPPTTPILRGRNAHMTLRDGLYLHYSDTEVLEDFVVDTESQPQIGLRIFLRGSTDASLGGCRLPQARPDAGGSAWRPVASLVSQAEPDRFVRRARRGETLRKVVVSVSSSWLEGGPLGGEDLTTVRAFARSHLASHIWVPSGKAVALSEQIINAPDVSPLLRALYLESRALALIAEAFEQCFRWRRDPGREALRPLDRQRLQRIEDYLERFPRGEASIAALAREARTSANTLQRLFRSAYGTSVQHFVRARRLERARRAMEQEGASIGEAAFLAGYGSPANFSTAFKRHFGLSPSDLQSPC